MEKTKVLAYLAFTGNDDFPLEVFTKTLQVEPSEMWKMGEPVIHSPFPRTRKFTMWQYGVEKETVNVDDVLMPVIHRFESKEELIVNLIRQYNVGLRISIVIQIYDGLTPGFVINPEASAFATAIGANFDIDLYAYPYCEVVD